MRVMARAGDVLLHCNKQWRTNWTTIKATNFLSTNFLSWLRSCGRTQPYDRRWAAD